MRETKSQPGSCTTQRECLPFCHYTAQAQGLLHRKGAVSPESCSCAQAHYVFHLLLNECLPRARPVMLRSPQKPSFVLPASAHLMVAKYFCALSGSDGVSPPRGIREARRVSSWDRVS